MGEKIYVVGIQFMNFKGNDGLRMTFMHQGRQ